MLIAEAMQYYREAIKMAPELWEGAFGLAGDLGTANQPEEAMREYSAALKNQSPSCPQSFEPRCDAVAFQPAG